MTKVVTGTIPNLINGVSQQAPALRLATQTEEQEGFYSTIVDGLKDRPPSEFVARLLTSLPDSVFTHVIDRDNEERYIVVSDGTSIRVWDFAGNEKTVNAPGGYAYIEQATDAHADLAALTVADYTFIANKKVVVEASADVEPVRAPEALINVLAGNYGKTYSVIVNGGTAGYFQTPDGSTAAQSTQVDTVYIAGQVAASMIANGFNDGTVWKTTQYQNAIHLQRLDGGDFTITVADGYNGNAMKAAKGSAQRFSDLPQRGPAGVVCEVIGDNSNQFDNYWVKLQDDGLWRECVKPGTTLGIEDTTMPHALVREADGTFTFKSLEWDDRKCGDDEISPDPSFVNSTIEDVFFHRNRLGFLCSENAVMSRNGSFFDFFRTTATAILDDDPIDTSASHVKVSLLKHAVPFQDDLLLFSALTQFKLAGNEMLTPKTVSIKPLTEYANDAVVHPLALGTSVFFSAARGDWEGIWEYSIDKATGVPDVDEITSHVPAYIPAPVYKIAGSSNEHVAVVLTKGDPSALYVHKYYWSGNQKLQSAWQRWRIDGATILNAEFVESDLYIVCARADGIYLEKLRMQPNAFDEGMGFMVHLDQRVHTDALDAPTYESGATTFTLPYRPDDTLKAVTAPDGEALAGLEPRVLSVDTDAKTITLEGDHSDNKLWFGHTFERRYRFSQFFLRQPNASGGTQTIQSGRLQLRHMTLTFDKSAYFRVVVTLDGRENPYVYHVTGRVLGDSKNTLGTVPLLSGKKSIPIMARHDRVTIDIINDSWMPSSFISVEWVGTHNEKAREL